MLENCIELMLSAFYSQSRTIVRMNIDADVAYNHIREFRSPD